MAEHCTRPVLMIKDGTRYGGNDYMRFDDLASTHMTAGRGRIGKVEVDCRFVFSKSHWGVIGESKHPGGIIYLDLNFRQPLDCKLESATVTVTLSEDDERGQHACPVKFTHHYGPKELRGQETPVQMRRVKKMAPEVHVLGYGGGGLGVDKEKVVWTHNRWSFAGNISPGKGSPWDRTLQWDLRENPQDLQPKHSNMFHTAFALEHNAKRFYMTVQVSGKLASLSGKVRNRFKFGSNDQKIVTRIEWTEGYRCPLQLDMMAKDLHLAMEVENQARVPIEIRDALPATFRPATPIPPSETREDQQAIAGSRPVEDSSSRPMLEPGRSAEAPWAPLRTAHALEHPAMPGLEDLSMVSGLAPSSSAAPHILSPVPTRPRGQESNQGSEALLSCAPLLDSTEPRDSTVSNDSVRHPQDPEAHDLVAVPVGNAAVDKAVLKVQETMMRTDGNTLLLLQWVRNLGIQLLILMASILQIPAEIRVKDPGLAADGGRERVKPKQQPGPLRLTVPQQESSQSDYDGDTCVGSSGLTPGTVCSALGKGTAEGAKIAAGVSDN